MPRTLKNYTDPTRLFARHKVESYLCRHVQPTFQLKSGGYIVNRHFTERWWRSIVNFGAGATRKVLIEGKTALKENPPKISRPP